TRARLAATGQTTQDETHAATGSASSISPVRARIAFVFHIAEASRGRVSGTHSSAPRLSGAGTRAGCLDSRRNRELRWPADSTRSRKDRPENTNSAGAEQD